MTFVHPHPGTRERAARRRRRELDRQQIQFENAPEDLRALYEVERYESYLEVLRSVHRECSNPIDWNALKAASEPAPPERTSAHEEEAERDLASYSPGWLDKLLGRAERTLAHLRAEVEAGQRTDAWAYEQAVDRYRTELDQWRERRALAERVLNGEFTAFRDVLADVDPFCEIRELGSRVDVEPDFRMHLHVNEAAVLPKEMKSLKSDGRLWARPMSPEQIDKLELAYASSCALRIAGEVFALLPLDTVAVSAPMFTLRIPRQSLERIDLAQIDPVRQITESGW